MAYEFRLPDIGEGLHEAEILKWFVKVGQTIKADESIAEIQTDKAAVELTSPVGGQVLSIYGALGSTVKVGEVLVKLDTTSMMCTPREADSIVSATAVTRVNETERSVSGEKRTTTIPAMAQDWMPAQSPFQSSATETANAKVKASPAVRKLARDFGVQLVEVVPTGVHGRLTRADVQRTAEEKRTVAEQRIAAELKNDLGERREAIRGVRKRIYENMTKSMNTAPQTTGMDDLDVTNLVALRQRLLPFAQSHDIKLTYLPIIIKAVTHVLKEFPVFNASVDDEHMEIVYKEGIHIGIATATPQGLLVPVIHDTDKKSVFDIAKQLEHLKVRGRECKLELKELTGSTFTISNTGANGGWFATPIVNYPEVAILGVHSIAKRAVVLEDDSIVAQRRMTFSLTFDHRIIDGQHAASFMGRFKEYLEQPEVLLAL